MGLDGFSYPMVLLATLLSLVALLASRSVRERVKGYYVLVLVLETAMLGVFMVQDWSLFYVFWEGTLIPLFFLIDRWGGKGRQTASLNFVLYTMGGSVFMLISLLVLFDAVSGHSFAFAGLRLGGQRLDAHAQVLIFLGFLIGFGVKMPIFPIHGWLPLAHVEAPSPISILLSGVLLKMGSYGLIRAAYAIRTIGRLSTGPVRARMRDVEDLRPTEMVAAGVLSVGIIALGVFPQSAVQLMAASVANLSAVFGGT